MIRVFKREEEPKTLNTTKAYDGEDVQEALGEDQHDKCYLCERICTTDYVIDHFKCQKKHPELIREWSNLLFSCSYCNGRKSSTFDNLVNPITCNVEEEICQKIDFRKNRAVFSSTEDEAHAKTVELLERIYNGEDGKPRTRRERKFFGDAISVINQFQQTVNQYLAQPTPANEQAVRNELQIEQELLGFKYWIIRSSKVLEDVFQNDIKWNKR